MIFDLFESYSEAVEKARKIRAMIEKASLYLSDDDAFSVPELFPMWKAGVLYEMSDKPVRVRYNGLLYRLEQTHTSQVGWEPPIVPALWTQVAEPGQIDVWRQPTGAQDAYEKGTKVWYPDKNGHIYISVFDGANIWEPTVYGWELVE